MSVSRRHRLAAETLRAIIDSFGCRNPSLHQCAFLALALRLAARGLERLPVVNDSVARELVGIISRSDLLKPARALHEEEAHREIFFRIKTKNAHWDPS